MILVVDDQLAVLEVVAAMLRHSGLGVLQASCAADALRVLEGRADVTTLLTDCDMPFVSGAELAREVMERWPAIRIIAMSGQPKSQDMPTELPFISKPFRASALIALFHTPVADDAEARAALLTS